GSHPLDDHPRHPGASCKNRIRPSLAHPPLRHDRSLQSRPRPVPNPRQPRPGPVPVLSLFQILFLFVFSSLRAPPRSARVSRLQLPPRHHPRDRDHPHARRPPHPPRPLPPLPPHHPRAHHPPRLRSTSPKLSTNPERQRAGAVQVSTTDSRNT